MAGQANFSVVKGDTFLRSCTFRNKTTGVPINITGATVAGKILRDGVLTALTCTITAPTAGQFTFGLTALQTAALVTGINQIEVQITFADLTVKTLFSGNLIVQDQIV